MAETFSMSAAAGFAFRRRASGGLLTMAATAYVVGAMLILSVWATLNREALGAYLELALISARGATPDQARVAEVMGKLAPGYLMLVPSMGALYCAFEATCQRWMVRGLSSDRTAGLHWGADTWRLFAVFGMWILFGIAASFGVVTVAGLAGMIGGGAQNAAVSGLLALVAVAAALGVWFYMAVRLAPAAAITIGREKITFWEARSATQGRFWSLFGAFAFLGVLYVVASLIAQAVAGGLFLGPVLNGVAAGGDANGASTLQESGSLMRFGLFYLLVVSVAQPFMVGFMGVNALTALVAHDEGKV